MTANLGISDENIAKITDKLLVFLADTYVLYIKTQNYHWNITGRRFHAMHLLFEEQYTELAGAVDEIAERVRSLDVKVPGTMADFLKRTTLQEGDMNADANTMLSHLAADNQKMGVQAQKLSDEIMNLGSAVSSDLMLQRAGVHEKAAWMLRSHLE